jgi:glycine/D-amino acid oxidase-like deaminating enzyme
MKACNFWTEDYPRPADLPSSGHIVLAAKPKHFAAMAHELDWMRSALGYQDVWLVSKEQQQAEIGTSEFHGGLADGRSGALHPAKYVFGLAQAEARSDARRAHVVRRPAQLVYQS